MTVKVKKKSPRESLETKCCECECLRAVFLPSRIDGNLNEAGPSAMVAFCYSAQHTKIIDIKSSIPQKSSLYVMVRIPNSIIPRKETLPSRQQELTPLSKATFPSTLVAGLVVQQVVGVLKPGKNNDVGQSEFPQCNSDAFIFPYPSGPTLDPLATGVYPCWLPPREPDGGWLVRDPAADWLLRTERLLRCAAS